MTDFSQVLSGGATAWLYLPTALLLGALHALEPGHSKGLMASFIIATGGTAAQAVLLGLSAAFSHSIVVWALAAAGLAIGDRLVAERAEPYLLIVSGAAVIAMAAWMLFRTGSPAYHDHTRTHPHGHPHDHPPAKQTAAARDVLGFGLTAGLLPCPAAVTVLILCLNAGAVGLGIGMVAAFSAGLAVTLVAVGVAAALGASMAASRFGLWQHFGKYAPRISAGLIGLAGLVAIAQGVLHL